MTRGLSTFFPLDSICAVLRHLGYPPLLILLCVAEVRSITALILSRRTLFAGGRFSGAQFNNEWNGESYAGGWVINHISHTRYRLDARTEKIPETERNELKSNTRLPLYRFGPGRQERRDRRDSDRENGSSICTSSFTWYAATFAQPRSGVSKLNCTITIGHQCRNFNNSTVQISLRLVTMSVVLRTSDRE